MSSASILGALGVVGDKFKGIWDWYGNEKKKSYEESLKKQGDELTLKNRKLDILKRERELNKKDYTPYYVGGGVLAGLCLLFIVARR